MPVNKQKTEYKFITPDKLLKINRLDIVVKYL